MASFDTMGLDGLILDMEEITEIPDDVIDDMLQAGGEVIAKGHQAALQEMGLVDTGTLRGSVTIMKKFSASIGGAGGKYVLVYPQGTHHTYRKRTVGAKKKNSTGKSSNQDVGFVHEFGGHGNFPRQWMREANEKNADRAVDAEFAVLNRWHKSKGL